MSTDQILIGKGEEQVFLNPKYANRHGLIAGATGTGKTVTLQVLAEGFAKIGVPVFMADIKGDLSGIITAGKEHQKITERIDTIGIKDFEFSGYKAVFWDLFGKHGHPVRTTISDMGPLMLSRLMNLNDTQEGVINIAFKFADDEGLAMLDLDDLRTTLKYIGDNRQEFQNTYGNISSASVGAIQRRLLVLEQQGAENFFGEPALDIWDFMRTVDGGRGQINILVADQLMQSPGLYATFLLWLISELFEELPEVGDQDKPRLVFFFDEAHLLFDDAPKALIAKVEQVVKLIRSKGIGIYFITQNPMDIPDDVLGQLGNRVQHALRAFTPKDQKAVRAAAQTFRTNPKLDTEETITSLGVGEALVSVLLEDGIPSIVEKTLICPPQSRIGPSEKKDIEAAIKSSPLAGKYDKLVDRESAHEKLTERTAKAAKEAEKVASRAPKKRSNRQGIGEAFVKSATRAIGTRVGRQIIRGILGSIFRGR